MKGYMIFSVHNTHINTPNFRVNHVKKLLQKFAVTTVSVGCGKTRNEIMAVVENVAQKNLTLRKGDAAESVQIDDVTSKAIFDLLQKNINGK